VVRLCDAGGADLGGGLECGAGGVGALVRVLVVSWRVARRMTARVWASRSHGPGGAVPG
jgi:hypothetical protein